MYDPLFSVADQVVLVSGGSRGIGRAIAGGFAERDAQVVITGRNAESLQETATEISTGKHEVDFATCDVAKHEDIQQCVRTVLDNFGRIDTLINVAGVNVRKKAETFTVEEYDFILDINLKGAYLMSVEVGRHMIERRQGIQINVDSLNTYAPLKGVLPYAMSKWGMVGMTRGLATEWGPHGVRVNTLAPGFILTDLTRKLWSLSHMREWSDKNTPLLRLGEVEDMVGATIFMASKASEFMTGQVIRVDGGMSAGMCWPIEL